MRVLFVTFPWRTHLYLTVPMAWALRTAGHEVHVASSPELTGVITGTGLPAVAAGSAEPLQDKGDRIIQQAARTGMVLPRIEYDEAAVERLGWADLKTYYTLFTLIHQAANDSMVEDLVAYCRWWKPDLVVWESMSYAGAIAAAAVGVPHARMHLAMDVGHRLRRRFLGLREHQAPGDRDDPVAEWLGGWAGKYGFDVSEELLTGQFTIDQMPDSVRLTSEVRNVSVRYVPHNGPSVIPEWSRRAPAAPRVLATFGVSMWSVAGSHPISVREIQEILDSVADLDIELVLTLSEKFQRKLKRVPGNTRIVEFAPLHVVIPSCSAVIHHGGVPAFCGAASHGVPQLMVSLIAQDARVRGARLAELGAGLWIPPEEMTGPRFREDLVRLLEDPSFRSGAERLRREMLAQPSPNDVVPELEKLAAEYTPR
ncbi:activator-dependent family glycosyltransferase [Streptomyces sp. NPDC018031]|uniref:activator-dependent family glycosyltransferase n=1 Tax=Streptomyces sp. NPDC018031 TaxID=3365033 RepID=UPI0037A85C37